MAIFANIQQDLAEVFASSDWTDNAIQAYPINLQVDVDDLPAEFVRMNIIHGESNNYYGDSRISGMLRVDVFTAQNNGPDRSIEIADILDGVFQNKVLPLGTQTHTSTLSQVGVDPDNTGYFRSNYSVRWVHNT